MSLTGALSRVPLAPGLLVPVAAGSAPFAPTDIAGLQLWLKADAGTFQDAARTTPATTDADPVGGVVDQSGNANHAAEATAGKRMLLKTGANGKNGLSVLRADGVDDALKVASLTIGTFTAFLVFKASGTAGQIYEQSPNVNSNNGFYLYGDIGQTILAKKTAGSSSKNLSANWSTSGTWRVVSHRFDGTHAGHELWFNGVAQSLVNGSGGTADPGTVATVDALYIFARNESSAPVTGDLAEFLVYNSALSTIDRGKVETYLNGRWAVF